jgi:hypothetical protein
MIQLSNIHHHFQLGRKGKQKRVPVLHEIDPEVEKGGF